MDGVSSRWLYIVVSVADVSFRPVSETDLLCPDAVLLHETFLFFRCAAEPIWLIMITIGSAIGRHGAATDRCCYRWYGHEAVSR
jgi:hypothetical protein